MREVERGHQGEVEAEGWDLLEVGEGIKHWYNNLSKEKKKEIMNRAVEIAASKKMVLVEWVHELQPNMELPHDDHESDHDRRVREGKETKILEKAFATATGEYYIEHLKGEV